MVKLSERLLLVLPTGVLVWSVYQRGWDQFAINSPSIFWLFGVFWGLAIIPNLVAKIGGSTRPLIDVLDRSRSSFVDWWGLLVLTLATIGMVFLSPPGDTEYGWSGLFSVIGVMVLFLALLWTYHTLTYKLLFPEQHDEWLAPNEAGMSGSDDT